MVVRPNKPLLFSVHHFPSAVTSEMPKFKETVNGKKFLFIELEPPEVKQALNGKLSEFVETNSYQRLVVEANKAGLKVIPLDIDDKLSKELDALHKKVSGPTFNEKEFLASKNGKRYIYLMQNQREKMWLRMLEGKGKDTVIVMHPEHAREIAKQLKIPKENIIGKLQKNTVYRRISNQEAARIQKARLERRKRKAKQRRRK